jgi:hypothetical protein
MADLTITVNSVTTQESRAAQFALAKKNEQLAEQGLPPHASVSALIVDYINANVIPHWIRQEAESTIESEGMSEFFKNADDATRAQFVAILQA